MNRIEERKPEYALYGREPVRVLRRFEARADCRVCGGDGWLDHDGKSSDCEYCNGTGKELQRTSWAQVGYLVGSRAGTTEQVREGALIALNAMELEDVMRDAAAS